MKPHFFLLAVIGTALPLAAAAKAADYYVATSGDGGHSGLARASAWRTIARAAQRAKGGDTVHIQGGDYGPEQVVIEITAAEARPVVFEGYDGTPVLNGGRGMGLDIVSSQHVRIRNIKIMNEVVDIGPDEYRGGR